MSNPFKQIKQEAHLTDAEKLRMRNSLVLEMGTLRQAQRPIPEPVEGAIKSPFVFSSKYFFSGIAVLVAVVLVVANLQKQTMLTPSIMMEHQVASDSLVADNSIALQDNIVSKKVEPESSPKNIMQNIETNTVTMNQSSTSGSLFTVGSSNSSIASAPNARSFETSATTASFTAGTSAMSSFGPQIIMKFKPGNEYLKNYVPVCFTNGTITCYPGKTDLHEMIYLGNNYYTTYSAGDSFSFVTFVEAYTMKTDDELSKSYYKKGIQKTFKEVMSAGYECNEVVHTVEELKAIVASGSVEKCQKLW